MALSAYLDHEKLEQEMEVKKVKQEPLAERLGITDRHLRNLKTKDTIVSSSLLYNISKEFEKPMEDFLAVKEDPSDA